MSNLRKFVFGAAIALLALASAVTASASNVTFAYQGRVKVQGQPFNGTGLFKLSIINNAGNETLWSNDSSGSGGSQPSGSISVAVSDGVFNIIVGDTATGQDPISPTVFLTQDQLKLRVWFDGGAGFQQLNPDQKLTNLTLNVQQTGTNDFTIYVNGATGNDTRSGLSPAAAKKTIQAAVDSIPGKVQCNVTIDIADGVYRESVLLDGLSTKLGKKILFKGDEAWTSASISAPTVSISGADTGTSQTRDYALYATQCVQVYFQGINFRDGWLSGARVDNGNYYFDNCLFSNNFLESGLSISRQADVTITGCLADNNLSEGYWITASSIAFLRNSGARSNSRNGMSAQANCQVNMYFSGDYSGNTGCGLSAWDTFLGFGIPYYLKCTDNTGGAVVLYYRAQVTAFDINKNAGRFQISGNGGFGNIVKPNYGSDVWW